MLVGIRLLYIMPKVMFRCAIASWDIDQWSPVSNEIKKPNDC